MKNRKVIALLCVLSLGMVLSACGKKEEPVQSTTVVVNENLVNPNAGILLENESVEFEIEAETDEITVEPKVVTANGTGDTAEIEDEYDKAYEEQLAREESLSELPTVYMYATGTVNVRASADETSDIIGKYEKNDIVTVYEPVTEWAKVNFEGYDAYVKSEYLSLSRVRESTSASSEIRETQATVEAEVATETQTVVETEAVTETAPVTETEVAASTQGDGSVHITPSGLTIDEEIQKMIEEGILSVGGYDYSDPNYGKVYSPDPNAGADVDTSNVEWH